MTTETKNAAETARADIRESHRLQAERLEREISLLEMLPTKSDGSGKQDAPLVCNWAKPDPLNPRAWIGYGSPSYDPDKRFNPVKVASDLEAYGWSLIPEAALIKWDNYRHAIEPSALAIASTIERPRYKYTSGEAVAPYWVTPCQFTRTDIHAFMRGPDGLVYQVSIDLPAAPCHISCRRIEFNGGWRFEGPAHLSTPKHWPIVSPWSRGFRDTEQGISGVAYFHLDNAKAKLSEAITFLLSKPE